MTNYRDEILNIIDSAPARSALLDVIYRMGRDLDTLNAPPKKEQDQTVLTLTFQKPGANPILVEAIVNGFTAPEVVAEMEQMFWAEVTNLRIRQRLNLA